jgi:hypothetical protein
MDKGQLGKRIHPLIPISHGFTLLLHQKEGWESPTLPGLSVLE